MGVIENISNLIKGQILKQQILRNGAKIAQLGKPLQSMTLEEKNNYIVHLLTQLVPEQENGDFFQVTSDIEPGNKEVLNKVFEVLDSENFKISIIDAGFTFKSVLSNVNPQASNPKIDYYIDKQIILRYAPKQDLKSLLLEFNLHPYCEYSQEIFEKVYDILDKTDISLVLDNIQNSYRVKPKLMHFLIDKGVDITHVLKEMKLEDYYSFSGIDSKYDENFRWDNSKKYNPPSQEEIKKVLDSYIEMKDTFSESDNRFFDYNLYESLDENAQIYYSFMLHNGEATLSFLNNTDKLMSYIKEYGEKSYNLQSKTSTNTIIDLVNNSIQSYSSRINLDLLIQEVSKFPDDVLSKDNREKLVEDLSLLKKETQSYELTQEKRNKYQSIPEDDLSNYITSLKDEEELSFILNDYSSRKHFGEALKHLPKEAIVRLSKYSKTSVSLLMENENVSYEDILTMLRNKELNTRSIYDLVGEHTFNGKINNADKDSVHLKARLPLIDIVNSYEFKSAEDYNHIFLYYPTRDRRSHVKTWMENKEDIYPKNNNDLDDLLAISKALESFESSPYKNTRNNEFQIRINVDIKTLINALETNPLLADHIEWRDFDSELPKYVNTLTKYPSFSKYFIMRFANRDDVKEERHICEINHLKNIANKTNNVEAYTYDESLRNELLSILTSNALSREEVLKILSNSGLKSYLGSYLIRPHGEESKDPTPFIKNIDSDGRLLEFYNSLSQEHLDELVKSGVLYGDDMPISWIQSRFIDNIQVIEEYKDDIANLLKKNPNLFYTMNFNLLKSMDPKTIEFLSKYDKSRSLNPDTLAFSGQKIGETINFLRNRLDHPEGEIFSFLKLCSQFESEAVAKDFWNNFSIEEAIYISSCKEHVFSERLYSIGTKNIKYMKDMFKYQEEHFNEVINNPNSTKDELLDVYMQKFFGTPLSEVKSKVEEYGTDLPNIYKRYTSKEKLTEEEQMEFYSLRHIEFLKEIISISSTDTLRKLYDEFSQDPDFTKHSLVTKLMIEDHLKAAFTKEKNDNLYVPNTADKYKEVTIGREKVDVYKPKDDFNMLITVVGAYVQSSKLGNHPKEDWNNPYKNTSQDICTSVIGNDNLSMALNDNNLKFGFINIGKSDIRSEAPYDLSSNANQIVVNSLRRPEFRTIQSIKDNVRTGHSEHLLERNIEGEEGVTYKRQPDYIIAINKITKQDKIAAKDFGIPIVLLDTKEISKRESKKLEVLKHKIITEDENAPKFYSNALEELFIKYHNNYSGLIMIDKKSVKKNLNPKQMEDYLINVAKTLKDMNDPLTISKFNKLLTQEEEKREGVYKDYIPFEFDNIRKALGIIEKNKDQGDNKSTSTIDNSIDKYKVDVSQNFIQNSKDMQEEINKTYGDRSHE